MGARVSGSIVFAALLLSACASAGPSAPAIRHGYGEVVPGTSTRDEAIAKLGTPTSTGAIGNGNTLLQSIDYSPPHPIHVAISFAADGKMLGVQHVSNQ
jgi:hypothetical protein